MAVSLEDVAAKVEGGGKLTDADIDALQTGRDIITLGTLAESIRGKLHGPDVTFVRVVDLTIEAGPKGPGSLAPAAGLPAEALAGAGLPAEALAKAGSGAGW